MLDGGHDGSAIGDGMRIVDAWISKVSRLV